MRIQMFYDALTFTLTYVVWDEATKDAVVVDPVLNFFQNSGTFSLDSVKQLDTFIKEQGLKLHFILETHAHADHITGSQDLNALYPQAEIAIGENIKTVQEVFRGIFDIDVAVDGSQFDRLLKDNEEVSAGSLQFKVMNTPGHTPACVSYLIGDAVFVGDALFMPDYGTGRCDFPKGDAEHLFASIAERLYRLPDSTRVFVGHDYQPGGRELRYQTTIGESKASNIRLNAKTDRATFVEARRKRDAELDAPVLLLPSIQLNINAGRYPKPGPNGMMYLKLPFRPKRKAEYEP